MHAILRACTSLCLKDAQNSMHIQYSEEVVACDTEAQTIEHTSKTINLLIKRCQFNNKWSIFCYEGLCLCLVFSAMFWEGETCPKSDCHFVHFCAWYTCSVDNLKYFVKLFLLQHYLENQPRKCAK